MGILTRSARKNIFSLHYKNLTSVLSGCRLGILQHMQHLGLDHTLEDVGELLHEGLVAVGDPDVGHVGARRVVAGHALALVVGAQPAVLGLAGEAALVHGVPRDLAHVAAGQLPHLPQQSTSI